MDRKKVADLAKTYSHSCKKLVTDRHLKRTLTPLSVVLVSLTVINLVSVAPFKSPWWLFQ